MAHVVHLAKFYPPTTGGMERVVQVFAEGLAARGHCVSVVAFASEGDFRIDRPAPRIEVYRIPPTVRLASGLLARKYWSLARRLAREADIVHVHEPNPLALVALLTGGTRKPIHVTWHADITRQWYALPFLKPLQRRLCVRAQTIQATSERMARTSYLLPDFSEKTIVVPLGLDLAPYAAAVSRCADIEKLRARLGGPFVLAVGRMATYKGYDVLLRAVKGTNVRLVIVGDGPLRDELAELRKALRLEDQVAFAGSIDDEELALCYAACEYSVLASTTVAEAFGLVQVEAMACGKPVINTSVPTGVPEVGLDGVTGLTVPPADAEALRAALTRLWTDRPLREKLGEAARRRAFDIYDSARVIDQLIAAYGL